ncbi:MAG: hypothetical protein ACJARD_000829 [Alphaproteobacteria bacterium]|jgi:hypothetical protein
MYNILMGIYKNENLNIVSYGVYGLASTRKQPAIQKMPKNKKYGAHQVATSQPLDEDTQASTPDGNSDAATFEISGACGSDTLISEKKRLKSATNVSGDADNIAATKGIATLIEPTDMPYGLCSQRDKQYTQTYLKELKERTSE